MQFLIDADLSPRLVELFIAHGHDAMHVEDIAHGRAADPLIGQLAVEMNRCIITGDYDFADVRIFEPRRFRGIVVLTLPNNTGPLYITRVLTYFFARLPEFATLAGKLLIVELGRIRVRA